MCGQFNSYCMHVCAIWLILYVNARNLTHTVCMCAQFDSYCMYNLSMQFNSYCIHVRAIWLILYACARNLTHTVCIYAQFNWSPFSLLFDRVLTKSFVQKRSWLYVSSFLFVVYINYMGFKHKHLLLDSGSGRHGLYEHCW